MDHHTDGPEVPPRHADHLLSWYDRQRRDLPWRSAPGQRPDPYVVWLSEVMLQQTTVAAVIPYFRDFIQRWPSIGALAAAPIDDVLTAWAGLGYYARARNLHACARVVATEHDSRFPDDETALRRLPGIGRYTAAAIAAIAFDQPATVIDGNVERVVSRLFAVETPLPAAKPALHALAAHLSPRQRPGDYAQAMMDLGATLCTPVKPRCLLCPLVEACQAHAMGQQERYPLKRPKAERPTRFGVAFWTIDPTGAVLLRRRPPRGLLGGMTEIPGTAWTETRHDTAAVRDAAPATVRYTELPGSVRHTFTHFHLELTVWAAVARFRPPVVDGFWVALDALPDQALPSVMRKVVRHALAHA